MSEEKKFIVKILDIENVTHDVKRFKIEKPKGYEFTPGQATEVSINKESWKNKKRAFTFTCLNNEKNLEFSIKIYQRGGVTEEIGRAKIGDELEIGEPWGVIHYKNSGVFIAGGAGITPFIAIFRELNRKGKLKGNTLIFSNTTVKDILIKKKKFFFKK